MDNFANGTARPPLIGISGASTDSKSVTAMVAQVYQAGGIPMVLANHANRDAAADIEKLDGLIIMGNDFDVDPKKYINGYPEGDPRHAIHPQTNSASSTPENDARAAYEEKMLALAAQKNLPTLGVCGGMQAINVLRGGGILQHIPDLIGDNHHQQDQADIPPFCPVIPVTIERNSALGVVAGNTPTIYTPSYPPPMGTTGVNENSFHHQAIDPDRVGYGLRVSAYSDAYVNAQGQLRYLPEAIEPDPNGPLAQWPMRAVQWHPEYGASRVSANLIAATVDDAARRAMTSPRDRSNDMNTAMINNLISSKKPEAGFAGAVQSSRQQAALVEL